MRLRAYLLDAAEGVEVELSQDRILVEPVARTVLVGEMYANLTARTSRETRVGNYTVVVEGVAEEGETIRSSAECTLEVVSISIEEVKAYYRLDSFFLAG